MTTFFSFFLKSSQMACKSKQEGQEGGHLSSCLFMPEVMPVASSKPVILSNLSTLDTIHRVIGVLPLYLK